MTCQTDLLKRLVSACLIHNGMMPLSDEEANALVPSEAVDEKGKLPFGRTVVVHQNWVIYRDIDTDPRECSIKRYSSLESFIRAYWKDGRQTKPDPKSPWAPKPFILPPRGGKPTLLQRLKGIDKSLRFMTAFVENPDNKRELARRMERFETFFHSAEFNEINNAFWVGRVPNSGLTYPDD